MNHTTVLSVFLIIWAVCAILTYGLLLAYYQRKYPKVSVRDRWTDFGFCLVTSVCAGPCALCAALIFLSTRDWFKYGFMIFPANHKDSKA